jgi:hypothetical protein
VFHHDGKLIISHGCALAIRSAAAFPSLFTNTIRRGGKRERLHTRKDLTDTRLADDQLANDKSVRALINNYEQGKPLVLVVDDKYPKFPFDLAASNVTYAVLGFYKITHTWGTPLVFSRNNPQ